MIANGCVSAVATANSSTTRGPYTLGCSSPVHDAAGFELGLIGVILADKPGLDALLAGNGRSEHVPLDSSRLFLDFANTFLRKIWHFDFQNPDANADGQNLLDKMIDGSGHPTETDNANGACAGFIPLTPYSPWVWTRCRDATFHDNVGRGVANEAALLRYRQ